MPEAIVGAMITQLFPSFSAVFPDVFLSKVAEQGFGVPMRQLMAERANGLPRLQEQVNRVISLDAVRRSFDHGVLAHLKPIRGARALPHGFVRVDGATAAALVELMIFKDGLLSALAGANDLSSYFTAAKPEHRPWFLLLHSLEQTGVLKGIEEIEKGSFTAPGFPGHPGRRSFVLDDAKLRDYRRDAKALNNARVVTERASGIDADASDLLRHLQP